MIFPPFNFCISYTPRVPRYFLH